MGVQSDADAGLLTDVSLPPRYRIIRRLARGGMAEVWCAEDTILGRHVAIKILGGQFGHDGTAVRRFRREARAAARLSGHPHVVTIYDVSGGEPFAAPAQRPFIVMEHLSGGTVADALRVGEVSRQDALRWLEEAASGLDYAHGRGVVHRDIKPGNLLLDGNRVLHVADFGIARIGTEDTLTSAGQMFGTAAYLAPEQALGRPATEASDRYALAVVGYELLAGQRPFTSENFAVQARHHVESEPTRASRVNRSLPASVDGVLARGMAKRPEERFATATEFAAATRAAIEAEPRTQVLRRPRAATRTRARRAAGAGALAGAAAAGAGAGADAAAAASAARSRAEYARPASPPPSAPRGPAKRREQPRPRVFALMALAAAAFAVGIAAGTTGEQDHSSSRASVSALRSSPKTTARTTPKRPVVHTHTVTVTHASPPPPTHTVTAQATPAAATTPAPPTADTLEARGHQLMVGGQYTSAIPLLEHAVSTASPASLTYAYALFDLGHSLRMAGDLPAAAAILQRRLAIPNQTEVVRQELQTTLRQIGAQAQSSPTGGAPAGPPKHRKH
jgi:serine/threonine-protein kinase